MIHVKGQMVSMTKTHEGYNNVEVVQETQLKGMQVTYEMPHKFKLEIHQNLVHTLVCGSGSGLEE